MRQARISDGDELEQACAHSCKVLSLHAEGCGRAAQAQRVGALAEPARRPAAVLARQRENHSLCRAQESVGASERVMEYLERPPAPQLAPGATLPSFSGRVRPRRRAW